MHPLPNGGSQGKYVDVETNYRSGESDTVQFRTHRKGKPIHASILFLLIKSISPFSLFPTQVTRLLLEKYSDIEGYSIRF